MSEFPVRPESVNGESFSRHIGERIRHFRKKRAISLSELCRRAGLAKGTLSRLEAGQGNPTIMRLGALAAILGVTPGDFINQTEDAPSFPAVPRDLPGPVIRMLFVHRVVAASTWDVYETTIPSLSEPIYSATHAGIEHLMMIEGAAEVGPVDAPVRLKPGQHIAFSGNKPHLYWSLNRPSRALLMMEYPGRDNDVRGAATIRKRALEAG